MLKFSQQRCRVALLGTAMLAALFICPAAQAVEIAYEGFNYPTGYLSISESAGFGDGIDDGTGSVVDPVFDSELDDPAHNGGTGPWVNGWTKRIHTTRSQIVDGSSTLSYTDSNGNALATTMGRARFPHSFSTIFRNFDPSVVDPALTIPNTGVNAGNLGPTYDGPTLGKQGTVIWFSMLADFVFDGNDHGTPALAIQFQNKRDGDAADGEPQSITGGITGTADGWAPYDVSNGEEDDHAPGLGFTFLRPDEVGTNENMDGSAAADAAGDIFIVGKFDYNATFDFFGNLETDGWADVTYWVNPDLDAEPLAADAALTGSAFYPINGIALLGRGNAPSNEESSSFDEIRFGTTFADVAPIDGGGTSTGPGDFAGDGIVEGADLTLLLDNWNKPAEAAWVTDRPTPEGSNVAGDELTLLLDNWTNDYTSGSFAAATIPEPSTMAIVLLATLGGLATQRRRCY